MSIKTTRLIRDRCGVYYFRLIVPLGLRETVGKVEFRRSLRTKDSATARQRALALSVAVEEIMTSPKVSDFEHLFRDGSPTRKAIAIDHERGCYHADNLTNIKPELLRQHPEILPTLRMSTCLMRAVILAPFLLSPLFAWGSDLTIGKPAPGIEVKLLETSQTLRLSGATGKVTLVNFWATWCAPCREEMPAIQAYYDKHKSEGLQVIAISMDEPSKLDEVRRMASHYTFPVAMKNEADIKGFGRIWRLPSTFVIDRQGILRKNGHEGDPTVDLPALEALVTPLLSAH